jgi:ribosomal protein S18 acetylase RimI-like enzyme
MILRSMIPEDQPTLVELARDTGAFKPHEVETLAGLIEWYFAEAHAEEGHLSFVGLVDDRIVGFVYYAPEDPTMTDRTWTLYWIAVSVVEQGQGLGRRLMNFVEDDLKQRGARLLLIETSSTPQYESTRIFYQRLGYAEVACVPDFYAEGDGKVFFSRKLR